MNNTNAIERLRATATASRTETSLRKRIDGIVQSVNSSKTKVLLLDVSSSMNEYDNAGVTRIEKLWNIVQQLRAEGLRFRIATFNHNVEWSDAVTQPSAHGGTVLDEAFEFVSREIPAATLHSVTVVHDGQPFDPDAALASALTLRVPVNVLFVGNSHDTDALRFAQTLAERTNGRFAQSDINVSEQLALRAENEARLMLAEHSTTRSISL